ncbi:hypothetical protein [Bosea sp. PAMC 26642]|uniref:hypothetical protein n=1 Tax=Bosea sp. (strain PAMC 26642) TaxID=1792307 RepID=UPI0007704CBA|nr:hypothetical protein [Bosea sp. PAMC 26642]AMJ59899.1 hypothetical protein AXW83_05950 [Bosea sp. PAMC 26642]
MFFKRKSATLAAQANEPAPHSPVGASRQRPGWFEKRDRRRRRRKMFEEVLGWILVPAFIYLIYLGVKAVGGIPKELIDFGNELIGLAMKGMH